MTFIYRGDAATREEAIDRLEKASVLACDTETVNLNDHTCLGIGFYISNTEGYYFRIFPETDRDLPLVMGILSDPRRTKIFHNGMGFDFPVLDKLSEDHGYSPIDTTNIADTEIMAKVSGYPGGLQELGQGLLHYTDLFSIQDLFDAHKTTSMLKVPWEEVGTKCLNDCRTTWHLNKYFMDRMSPQQLDCYIVDRKVVHLLRKVEAKGLALRQGVLSDMQEKLTKEIEEIRAECEELGFNPGSNQQVGMELARRGNMLPFTKSKRQLQVNEEVLEDLDDPLAARILKYRGLVKTLSTYVTPWVGKERAYSHFRLDLATGRLASGRINNWDDINRNLQNIPPDMRQVFRPDKGIWTWADHGQIELRVLAYMSRDSAMMAEYAKAEPDLHTMTANAAEVSRGAAKTFNFARIYGASDTRLVKSTGVSRDKIQSLRATWGQLFPNAQRWLDKQYYQHNGIWVESEFGRRMRLPELGSNKSANPKAFAAHVAKCAMNYPIQGTAADIVKRGMLKLDSMGLDLRLQLHDEYLIDGDIEFPERELANVHPELHTPLEIKKSIIWS